MTKLEMSVNDIKLIELNTGEVLLIDGIEYDGNKYRARISDLINPIRFFDTYSDGHKIRIIAAWGYQIDEHNRIDRRGYVVWDDDDDEKEADWLATTMGDVMMQWFLPATIDFVDAVIDWCHPDIVVD